MNSPYDIIRKRLEVILAGAEDFDGDSIILKVDSPPLVDGFQPIGETNVDEKAVAIIGNYLQSQEGCITSRGISWKVSSYDQNRIEINRIRPKGKPAELVKPESLFSFSTEQPDKSEASDSVEVARLVNLIFANAIKCKVSWICIEPSQDRLVTSFEIDGDWVEQDKLDLRFLGVITQRILNISRLKSKTLDQEERQILATDIKGKKHDIDVNVFPTAKGPGFKMHLCEGINSETETTNGNNTENNTLKDFLNIPVAGDNKVKDLLMIPVAGLGALVLLFLCNLGSYLVTGENDFIEETFHLKSQSARKTESVAVSESSEPVTQPTSSESFANPSEGTWAGLVGLSVDPTPESFEKFVQNAITFITQITPLKEDGGTYRFDLQKSESLIAPYQGMFSKTFKISYGDDEVEIHYTWDISAELGLVKGKWEYQSVLVQGGRRVSTSKKLGADNKSLEFNRAWVRKEAINASPTTPTTIRYTNLDQLKESNFGKREAEILLMSSKSKAYRDSLK